MRPPPRRSKLDIYLPEHGEGPFPVFLYVHGGAFAIGDKRDIHVSTGCSGWTTGMLS